MRTCMHHFKKIGIFGRQRTRGIIETLHALITLLQHLKYEIIVEQETSQLLTDSTLKNLPRQEMGKHCDLIIVVGGDGSLLNAAHAVVDDNVPILGINRGRLGFLTDIHPTELQSKVKEVLNGQFTEEKRFLLTAKIENDGKTLHQENALNDVVLLPGDVAHMIEFDVYINDQLVSPHRADGLIVATPTGSTAYALSGGGPIIEPSIEAVVLVPMFPHTLSSRPLVTTAESTIKITIGAHNETSPQVSCDGQRRIAIAPGSTISITKKKQLLRLIHPISYNYFHTLRTKLHWGTTF